MPKRDEIAARPVTRTWRLTARQGVEPYFGVLEGSRDLFTLAENSPGHPRHGHATYERATLIWPVVRGIKWIPPQVQSTSSIAATMKPLLGLGNLKADTLAQ